MKRADAQLVKEVLEGNIASFSVLVCKYQGAVYGMAYHIVRNFADAEDLAQEAFLQAYLELSQLRDPSKFAGWLRQITYSVCNMWLRGQRIANTPLDATEESSDIDPVLDPALEVEKKELCDAVLKAINSLSEKNRLVVTLFYMDGLSYKQISEFLEVPVTTVESRLHKARKQLKEEMMEMVEQDFSEKKLGPEFANKVAEGILEIVPSGYGFIRQGEHRKLGEDGIYKPGKDDVYVSPSQIRRLGLKTGDIVKGETHPPREDRGEHYRAMLHIQAVNTVEVGKAVEGTLEIVPSGYGFIRQGGHRELGEDGVYKPRKDDVYVSPSQIRMFGLKTGDVIKGTAFPPIKDAGEHYYALMRIDKVNGEDPQR